MTEATDLPVQHAPERERFEIVVGDDVAHLDYMRQGRQLSLVHTEVPAAMEGHGLASRLARAALDYAREARLRVVPFCPFVRSYVKRHPEYEDLLER